MRLNIDPKGKWEVAMTPDEAVRLAEQIRQVVSERCENEDIEVTFTHGAWVVTTVSKEEE